MRARAFVLSVLLGATVMGLAGAASAGESAAYAAGYQRGFALTGHPGAPTSLKAQETTGSKRYQRDFAAGVREGAYQSYAARLHANGKPVPSRSWVFQWRASQPVRDRSLRGNRGSASPSSLGASGTYTI